MGKRRGQDINGVLLLDKPIDMSSNHALQRIRRLFDAKKAGHTGTLDPFATGLLICCFGLATKICGPMLNAGKRYRATLQFGSETDSGDLTGITTQQALSFTGVEPNAFEAVCQQFLGTIEQTPPMHSALKKDGKPLYEYARQGIELAREPRQVTIYSLATVDFTPRTAVIEVACSKGTYIRTLAQDIGRALGCFAHLTALRRLSVGEFSLDGAYTLEALSALKEADQLEQTLIPLERISHEWLPSKLLKRIHNDDTSNS